MKKTGIADELTCNCENSNNEYQIPLHINIESKAILRSIRRTTSGSVKISNKQIKAELVQLKEQVKVLNLRAIQCEGELRVKEKENNELKDIMIELKNYISGNEVDKVADSSCQTCQLF